MTGGWRLEEVGSVTWTFGMTHCQLMKHSLSLPIDEAIKNKQIARTNSKWQLFNGMHSYIFVCICCLGAQAGGWSIRSFAFASRFKRTATHGEWKPCTCHGDLWRIRWGPRYSSTFLGAQSDAYGQSWPSEVSDLVPILRTNPWPIRWWAAQLDGSAAGLKKKKQLSGLRWFEHVFFMFLFNVPKRWDDCSPKICQPKYEMMFHRGGVQTAPRASRAIWLEKELMFQNGCRLPGSTCRFKIRILTVHLCHILWLGHTHIYIYNMFIHDSS